MVLYKPTVFQYSGIIYKTIYHRLSHICIYESSVNGHTVIENKNKNKKHITILVGKSHCYKKSQYLPGKMSQEM